jgi:hypothetical protein
LGNPDKQFSSLSSTPSSIPTYLQRKHAAGIGKKAPENFIIRAEKKGD